MTQTLAILGASSQIARDLIRAMVAVGRTSLLLYVRDIATTKAWVADHGLTDHCNVLSYENYDKIPHDAVLNFVGVGDPRRAVEMGASIFEVTQRFDELALKGLIRHPGRRYIFLSSGAVYGNVFHEPVTAATASSIPINAINPQDWYAVAKLHAEVRHRAQSGLPIIDLRVFNYFSRTQDLSARFFITDLLRSIRDGEMLRVSADFMVRDFLHPQDFHQLIERVLAAPPTNAAIDCYSASPVTKSVLLQEMHERFGLCYEVAAPSATVAVNATGVKPHYYSLNRAAESFGYSPKYSSLAGVLQEAAELLA
jgi:nucleoside-diphosphate-sugar epimerase